MSPLAHVFAVLVSVVGYIVIRDRRLPSRWVVGAASLGGLFPDLVDKPLAHSLFVLPSGRVGVHSLSFALPLIALVLVDGWRTGRVRVAATFGLGVLLHPLGDWHAHILAGSLPSHLVWPLPSVPVKQVPGWSVYVSAWTAFAITVLGVTALVMLRDVRHHVWSEPAR